MCEEHWVIYLTLICGWKHEKTCKALRFFFKSETEPVVGCMEMDILWYLIMLDHTANWEQLTLWQCKYIRDNMEGMPPPKSKPSFTSMGKYVIEPPFFKVSLLSRYSNDNVTYGVPLPLWGCYTTYLSILCSLWQTDSHVHQHDKNFQAPPRKPSFCIRN